MYMERRRISRGLLIPLTAVFLAIGSVGYAAAKVDTHNLARGAVTSNKLAKKAVTKNKIKKHSVNGSKVADDSLTGTQIDESTLGVVPLAAQANSADTATNADNATHADTADTAANGAVQFKFFASTGQTADLITVQGARFHAECSASDDLSAEIVGTAANGIAKAAGVDEADTAYQNPNDDLDTNDTVDLLNGVGHTEVTGQGDYMGTGGSPVVDANYATEDGGNQANGSDCAIWGAANVF